MRMMFAGVVALSALAISASDARMLTPRNNLLDSPNQTVWLSDRVPAVGDVFRSDPSTWSKKNGAQFNFIYRGLAFTTRSAAVGQQEIHTKKSADLGLLAPILKFVGASYQNVRQLDVTFTDVSYSYADRYLDITNALRTVDQDRAKNNDTSNIFSMMRADGTRANGDAGQSSYWIVTQVYTAGKMALATASGSAVSGQIGCPTIPATAAPSTPVVGATASTLAKPASEAASSVDGKPPCTLGRAALTSEAVNKSNQANAVIAVKVVPIYYNARTGLYRVPDESELLKLKPRGIVGS